MYGYGRYSHQDPNVRAGDADRDEIGERLRRNHAEGRIDAQEFQDRIDRCYHAKTVGDLQQLVNDLPREHDEQAERPVRRLWPVPLIPLVIAVWAITIATGWHHGHWGLPWLIPLLFAIRFLVWPYGRWGMRHRYRTARDV